MLRFLLPAAIVSVTAQVSPSDAVLTLLSQATIDKYNARCLDGSPPGFYYRPSTNSASQNKWKLHLQGGGWAFDANSAYSRSNSILGSSSTWTNTLSQFWAPEGAGFYGLMSSNYNNSLFNPFGDYNFVWIAYCDGSSYSSDRTDPLQVNGKNLYFRGRAILDGIIEELESSYGFLSSSTDVIVSGTSAGGLATYLHGSYFKARINKGAKVVMVPDAGFFFDHANFYGVHSFKNEMSNAIVPSFWNSTLRGDAANCVADKAPTNTTWQCFFPEHLYPYQQSIDGIFILNSLYDTAQMGLIFDLPCNLYTTCNVSEAAAVQQYAADLNATITLASSSFPARDGFFLTSCYQHEESCKPWDWFGIDIQGNTPNSTLYNWYTQSGEQTRLIDVPWPNDGSCAPQGTKWDHGAC
jgi:O-palmitoleoyl-L-serine hydrolase